MHMYIYHDQVRSPTIQYNNETREVVLIPAGSVPSSSGEKSLSMLNIFRIWSADFPCIRLAMARHETSTSFLMLILCAAEASSQISWEVSWKNLSSQAREKREKRDRFILLEGLYSASWAAYEWVNYLCSPPLLSCYVPCSGTYYRKRDTSVTHYFRLNTILLNNDRNTYPPHLQYSTHSIIPLGGASGNCTIISSVPPLSHSSLETTVSSPCSIEGRSKGVR